MVKDPRIFLIMGITAALFLVSEYFNFMFWAQFTNGYVLSFFIAGLAVLRLVLPKEGVLNWSVIILASAISMVAFFLYSETWVKGVTTRVQTANSEVASLQKQIADVEAQLESKEGYISNDPEYLAKRQPLLDGTDKRKHTRVTDRKGKHYMVRVAGKEVNATLWLVTEGCTGGDLRRWRTMCHELQTELRKLSNLDARYSGKEKGNARLNKLTQELNALRKTQPTLLDVQNSVASVLFLTGNYETKERAYLVAGTVVEYVFVIIRIFLTILSEILFIKSPYIRIKSKNEKRDKRKNTGKKGNAKVTLRQRRKAQKVSNAVSDGVEILRQLKPEAFNTYVDLGDYDISRKQSFMAMAIIVLNDCQPGAPITESRVNQLGRSVYGAGFNATRIREFKAILVANGYAVDKNRHGTRSKIHWRSDAAIDEVVRDKLNKITELRRA